MDLGGGTKLSGATLELNFARNGIPFSGQFILPDGTDALDVAERAGDYPGFSYAVEDYLDLIRFRDSGIIPGNPTLQSLLGSENLASRLGNVFQADAAKPAGQRRLGNQSLEIRRLVRILQQMPSNVTFAADPFLRAYNRMDDAISSSLNALASQSTSLGSALELLDAGILHSQLRDRFNFSQSINWEDNSKLSKVVAGRVAGSYQGYKLKFLFAFNLLGPIGLCLDVNAGNVGIPLGQTGFLFTGASGGVSFVNSSGDPCNFNSYLDPVTGKPVSASTTLPANLPSIPVAAMSWAALKDFTCKFEEAARAYGPSVAANAVTSIANGNSTPLANSPAATLLSSAPANAAPAIPSPEDCPPPTVNIFCQPHPDQEKFPGRIIMKFTSIDEQTLNHVFGITEDRIQQLKNSGVNIAATVAHDIRLKIDQLLPDPIPNLLGADRANRIRALQDEALNEIEGAFMNAMSVALANQSASANIYQIIKDLAYAGLPCSDVTFKVSATFSHLAVSSFMSVTGEGTLSSTGTAGVGGKVNFLGLPVGTGKIFLAATDNKGLPNPSACGEINVAFGPLQLGNLKSSLECDDCVTGVLNVFGQLAGSLSVEVLNNLISRVAPQLSGKTPQELTSLLSPTEKTAFMAELFQLPVSVLPSDLPRRLITALGASFDRIDPQILLQGEEKPKLICWVIHFGKATRMTSRIFIRTARPSARHCKHGA